MFPTKPREVFWVDQSPTPEEPQTEFNSVELEIDYSIPIQDLIRERLGPVFNTASLFDSTSFLTIPNSAARMVNLVIVRYPEIMTTEEVISDMDRHGIKPADLRELLFFCLRLKKKFQAIDLVALGSTTDLKIDKRNLYNPFIRARKEDDLFLNIIQRKSRWTDRISFLGVYQQAA